MPKISELTQLLNPTGAELIPVADGSYTKHVTAASLLALAGGGATVTVSDDAPAAENEGDLWYTPTDGSLYVWVEGSLNAWVQTNGGGGSGASVTVSDTAPADAGEGDLWFDDVNATLYVYIAGTTNAWIAISGGGQSGGGGNISGEWQLVTRVIDGTTTYTNNSGGLIFGNLTCAQNAADNLGVDIEITVNGVTTRMNVASDANSSGGQHIAGQYMVPAGATYKFHRVGRDLTGVELSYLSFHEMELKGGGGQSGGGASVTTGTTAPASPADGDLWFDETVAELYVYLASESAWVQTNGGGGGGGGEITFLESEYNLTSGFNSLSDMGLDSNATTVIMFVKSKNTTTGTSSVNVAVSRSGETYNTRSFYSDSQGLLDDKNPSSEQFLAPVITNESGVAGIYVTWANMSIVRATGYILFSGGGGGSGPRAYVAFDGTAADLTASITNSHNVTSIADAGTGRYDIVWTTPVTDPVFTVAAENHNSQLGLAGLAYITSNGVRLVGHTITSGSSDPPYISIVAH